MNDSFDRNLVLIIFIISFMYLKFLNLQIQTRSGWANTKCNPLSLFTNSIFQSDDAANNDFEKCVVHLSKEATTSMFTQHKNDQNAVISRFAGIEKKYDNLSEDVTKYTKEIDEVGNDYNKRVKEVTSTQENANTLNKTTTGKIDYFLEEIRKIFGNISTYFK